MGCAPTTQRNSQIPSKNALRSSKSTKSTLKNSYQFLSPQRAIFRPENQNIYNRRQKYYSPRPGKARDQQKRLITQSNLKNIFINDEKRQVKIKNFKELYENHLNPDDIVSHLSLNSQNKARQNVQEQEKEINTKPNRQLIVKKKLQKINFLVQKIHRKHQFLQNSLSQKLLRSFDKEQERKILYQRCNKENQIICKFNKESLEKLKFERQTQTQSIYFKPKTFNTKTKENSTFEFSL